MSDNTLEWTCPICEHAVELTHLYGKGGLPTVRCKECDETMVREA